MKHLRVTLALLALAGCAASMGKPAVPMCSSDDACSEGQVCFVDGCGDPARGVVVELTGSALAGQYAQDFAMPDGGLTGRVDLAMRSPLVVQGEFQRELSATVDPTNRTLYSDAVVVRATGVSENLPGISRTYEARFDKTERGVFSMALGSGIFSVMAVPADPSIPPGELDDLLVRAQEQAPAVKFAFPSIDGTVMLSGRLVKKRVSVVPPIEIAVTDVAMDLQAYDPTTRAPLSQRVPVSSGTAGSRGDFVIALSPRVRDMGSFILVASPREAGSIVPTRTFSISNPMPSAVTLELGDYGDTVEQVKGVALDASGAPIAGASVIVEGTVGGGGTFRSRVAITDAQGLFALDLLRNLPDGALTATIAPPSDSRAGLTRVSVKVGPLVGDTVSLSPRELRCGDRLTVTGTLRTPSGQAATGVRVEAQELLQASERELAVEDPEAVSDANGQFTLKLDPGSWLFNFLPADEAARASRMVIVDGIDQTTGATRTAQDLGIVQLPKSRRVEGLVTAVGATRASAPVPYATVRFYRVAQVSGEPASLLMGEAVADGTGRYSVLLPTR